MSTNKPSPKPRKSRTPDNRPADVRFGEKLATELSYWERRFQNVRGIAYGRLAKGATSAQVEGALAYLQKEMEATLTAIRTIPERANENPAGPETPTGPFVIPGLGQARKAPPKPTPKA